MFLAKFTKNLKEESFSPGVLTPPADPSLLETLPSHQPPSLAFAVIPSKSPSQIFFSTWFLNDGICGSLRVSEWWYLALLSLYNVSLGHLTDSLCFKPYLSDNESKIHGSSLAFFSELWIVHPATHSVVSLRHHTSIYIYLCHSLSGGGIDMQPCPGSQSEKCPEIPKIKWFNMDMSSRSRRGERELIHSVQVKWVLTCVSFV